MDAGEDEEIPFVEPPSQDYYCPVCYELLTCPYQMRCCGNHLCRDCNGRLQATPNVNCPMCQNPGVDTVEDKFFIRLVHGLRVRCYHHQAGCGWQGELRELPNHVSLTKSDYVFVKCAFGCGQKVRRRELKLHKHDQCPKRPKTCEYCSYYNTHDVVTEKHYPICEEFPVECPNRCGMSSPTLAPKATTLAMRQMVRRARRFQTPKFRRKTLKVHLQTVCPLEEIECKYAIAGCPMKLARKVMDFHLQEAKDTHLQLVEEAFLTSLKEIAALKQGLKSSRDSGVGELESSKAVEQHLVNLPPVTFMLNEYSKLKEKKDFWLSPPFYSYNGGHKLQLKVYANGRGLGEDTHLSIYVHVMRGKNDSSLQWPLSADITVDLLSWNDDIDPHSGTIYLPGDGYCQQVVDRESATWGQSLAKFISLSSLDQYLEDDCLYIRVSSISVHNIPTASKVPSWHNPSNPTQCLCEITLPNFSKCKALDAHFFTPPFYTHKRGHQLHLRIHANGLGPGEDTHISVHAALTKGDFDDSLQWPFIHDVVYELVNWREDKNHHTSTIGFGAGDAEICYQVLEGNVAKRGYRNFFSIRQSALAFDSKTNTQYLEDDCLRIRVKEVVVYSTPNVPKLPSWQNRGLLSPWVCEFTLNEFSKRKQLDNWYYSDPFYTHTEGYKMQLQVYSNGYGSKQGTHVSIVAILKKGKYDDNLQWPFSAQLTVELLNWMEDQNHVKETLIFSKENGARVTQGEWGAVYGSASFVAHSSLHYNSSKNTEYLRDDCLRFRVSCLIHS